jgi:hypothetical protein
MHYWPPTRKLYGAHIDIAIRVDEKSMKNVSLGVSLFGRKMTLIEKMRRRINIVHYFIFIDFS